MYNLLKGVNSFEFQANFWIFSRFCYMKLLENSAAGGIRLSDITQVPCYVAHRSVSLLGA